MNTSRFKIDLRTSSSFPFGLYVLKRVGWLNCKWLEVYSAETKDQARAFYEKIKDLPEYLD